MTSRNGKLEVLRFLIEKGAKVSVRDSKINGDIHFNNVANSADIIMLLLGKRTYVTLINIDNKNAQNFTAEFRNLEAKYLLF